MEENKVVEPVVTEPVTEPVVPVETPPVPETKPLDKNQLLREMSKEYGVNLYSAEGLAEFKKYQDSQKTEQEKLQEELITLREAQSAQAVRDEQYQAQIAGLQLGIDETKLNDAIALARINMTDGQTIADGLAAVKEKYPDMFSKTVGTRTEVIVGTQKEEINGDVQEPDEALARYLKKQKK